MRFATSLIALIALIAAGAFPAAAQAQFGYTASSGPAGWTINISMGTTPVPLMRVPDALYSWQGSNQNVQTLANGTHITHQNSGQPMVYRDSMGRVRTEKDLGRSGPNDFMLVTIDDPVAGHRYVLDAVNLVAHRVLAQANDSAPRTPPATPGTFTASDGTVTTTAPLGTSTLFGVSVVGTLRTSVHPAGSRMGNDGPVTTTDETWVPPKLGITIQSVDTDPAGTVNTTTLKNFSTAEPDPSLFRVPQGYKIVDESGSFTIKTTAN